MTRIIVKNTLLWMIGIVSLPVTLVIINVFSEVTAEHYRMTGYLAIACTLYWFFKTIVECERFKNE